MSDIVIRTEQLTRHFGATVAVDQLSLQIRRGEVYGFLGHNGAGKTTTIRLINGVLKPSSGAVRVLDLDPEVDGPAVRQRTGVLTETPALDDRLTAQGALRYAADLYGVPPANIALQIDQLLAAFGLAERASERIGAFSRGMRQRLALARTLIHDPELLFLDEPTGGLDPVATRDVHQLIRRLSRDRGRTIFLCTHNLVEAQRLCDRVAVLAHGRLLAEGSPAELARRFAQTQRIHLAVDPLHLEQAEDALSKWRPSFAVESGDGEPGALLIQGIGRGETPALVSMLVAAGVNIYEVVPHEPSLEEVYLGLQHGSGERAAAEEVEP
jgi:ABC-2 type transport system ATP-binding protein